jgi:tetratricopeptide (TPR) repeat protein
LIGTSIGITPFSSMLDTGRIPLTGELLALFRKGLGCAAAEEFDQALRHYNQLLKERPDFYEAWYERGLVLEHLGCYGEAIASYDRALQLSSRDRFKGEVWHDRGNAFQYGLGGYQAALDCYDQALSLSADHEMAWHNRGNALCYGLKRWEEAIVSYNRALQINSQNYLTWRNRGNALVELHRYVEAIASYDQALALQPNDEIALQARDLAVQQTGLSGLRQPTTRPFWLDDDDDSDTLVEADEPQPPKAMAAFDLDAVVQNLCPSLVVEDDLGRRELRLEQAQYTVGRDPKNDICLQSQYASRFHAVLLRIDYPDGTHTYQIRDGDVAGKASTNGILINGHKYSLRALKAGDTIVFGPQVRATYQWPLGGLHDTRN